MKERGVVMTERGGVMTEKGVWSRHIDVPMGQHYANSQLDQTTLAPPFSPKLTSCLASDRDTYSTWFWIWKYHIMMRGFSSGVNSSTMLPIAET